MLHSLLINNLLERAKKHYSTLAPHIKDRVSSKLLKEFIDFVEKHDKLSLVQEVNINTEGVDVENTFVKLSDKLVICLDEFNEFYNFVFIETCRKNHYVPIRESYPSENSEGVKILNEYRESQQS